MKALTQIVVTTPDLYSITNAAKELGVSRMTIYRWLESDKIHAIKLGGLWYVPQSEVDRLRRAGENGSGGTVLKEANHANRNTG